VPVYNLAMPSETTWTLTELADLAGVTPRTIRYYIAQGLLPSPGQPGPGAKYGETDLARLRVIRRLQTEHLPLAEIRSRLAGLDDAAVIGLSQAHAEGRTRRVAESAVDYIRAVLAGDRSPGEDQPAAAGPASRIWIAAGHAPALRMADGPPPPATAETSAATPPVPRPSPGGERSQWERVVLAPDVELHLRRPLGRLQNRRVDRLIAIARELLEGDQP
jgi:DNA-binding transcriptional MerR regulator